MTRISSYSNDTTIEDIDLLIGTDKGSVNNETENYKVGDLKAHFINSIIVSNRTTSELTLSQLNSLYAAYPVGTQIICPDITTVVGQRFVYTKIGTSSWTYDTRPLVV